MTTDEQLMLLVQADDQAAFAELDHRYRPILLGYASKRLYGALSSRVEDIAQKTLSSVWIYKHTYKPERRVKPWIMTIAARMIAKYVQQSEKYRQAGGLIDAPTETTDLLEVRDELDNLVSIGLSDKMREAVTNNLKDGSTGRAYWRAIYKMRGTNAKTGD